MRESKHVGSTAVEHGPGHFEPGWIQREAAAQGLDQRLLYAPQPEEEMRFPPPLGVRQASAFCRAVDAGAYFVEVAPEDPLLHIDSEPVVIREPYQTVPAAVADIESDGYLPAVHPREGLAVFEVAERELAVGATEPLGEDDAKRGPTQGELPLGVLQQEAGPSLLLAFVEQIEGAGLAVRVVRAVHMQDGHALDLAPVTPPSCIRWPHLRGYSDIVALVVDGVVPIGPQALVELGQYPWTITV